MPYSTTSDLLLGDITIADGFDRQRYVNDAADEIDSMLGTLYVLPLVFGSLSTQGQLILKRINNWLATGQIITALAIGSEDTSLHAYGASMLKDARALLAQVASGTPPLIGAVLVDGGDSTGPKTVNYDEQSPLDAFEDRVMRFHPVPPPPLWGRPVWQPGKAP